MNSPDLTAWLTTKWLILVAVVVSPVTLAIVSTRSNLIPPFIKDLGVNINYNVDEVIEWADALNVLRIQRERMGIGINPSVREYRDFFGITEERLRNHKKEIVIMHPVPMNRGVEIEGELADGPTSVITEQVRNGVAMRMAILEMLANNGASG